MMRSVNGWLIERWFIKSEINLEEVQRWNQTDELEVMSAELLVDG